MRALVFFVVLASAMLLTGCMSCSTRQDPDELRRKTAQTTANLKQDAKAVAQGIREGLSRDDRLDLNTATPEQLAKLPGITPRQARRIAASRPYGAPEDLVQKGIVTREQYAKIAGKVTVKK